MIDMKKKNITLPEIIDNCGKSIAVLARRCKTSTLTIDGWRAGTAPRYKFVPLIAAATGVDETVVHDAIKRANQGSRQNALARMRHEEPAKTNCEGDVVDSCLVALDLASKIVCLGSDQQAMICSIVEAITSDGGE